MTKNNVMSIKFTKLTKILVISTVASISSLFAVEVMAQTEKSEITESRLTKSTEAMTLDEAFTDAYFKRGKNAFVQQSFLGQLNTIVGFTGFPEKQIAADAKAVYNLYQTAMERQVKAGMPIYTKDLVNPYETSLLENPSYIGSN